MRLAATMVCSQSLVAFVRSSTGEGVGISCCVAPGSEPETPAGPGANPERYLIRCGPRSPLLLWSYAVRSEASDGCGLVPLEPASAYPRWKHGEEEREKGEERKGRKEGGRPSPWTRSPPRASFSRRRSCSPNRIMEGKPRRAALVFLVAFVAVAAGSPACPRPSVVDTILGRPDSRWDSDSTLPLGAYQIGVVEGDEATLQKASSMVQKNREDYVALLFYASWCPFSKICHPNFQILSNLFPTIRHFAFEESVIRPSILSRYGVHGFPTLFLLNSTMRVRYHGSRTRKSIVAFYNHVTGVGPSPKLVFLDNVTDPPDDTELKEDMQENCPFSWARSPEKLLQQDGYLALASGFLLMRLLYFLLPRLNACFQRAWRRQMRYASVRNLWNYFQAYTEQAKQEGSRLHPCQRHHLQEGATSARAWASQSLVSVTLGEPSSGRAYSTGREKLGQDASGWL